MNRRFFIDADLHVAHSIRIEAPEYKDELKHMRRVLRLKIGDGVTLVNGRGVEAVAEIEASDSDSTTFHVTEVRNLARPSVSIRVAQAVLKGQRMDWLIEKLTEMGVQEICPLVTRYTTVDIAECTHRMNRWERIIKSAVKQSANPFLPGLQQPQTFQQFLTEMKGGDQKIYLHTDKSAPALWSTLLKNEKNICLVIGPEGGFHSEEMLQLDQAGFKAASLGEYILRGETAGLIATGVTQQWFVSQK